MGRIVHLLDAPAVDTREDVERRVPLLDSVAPHRITAGQSSEYRPVHAAVSDDRDGVAAVVVSDPFDRRKHAIGDVRTGLPFRRAPLASVRPRRIAELALFGFRSALQDAVAPLFDRVNGRDVEPVRFGYDLGRLPGTL